MWICMIHHCTDVESVDVIFISWLSVMSSSTSDKQFKLSGNLCYRKLQAFWWVLRCSRVCRDKRHLFAGTTFQFPGNSHTWLIYMLRLWDLQNDRQGWMEARALILPCMGGHIDNFKCRLGQTSQLLRRWYWLVCIVLAGYQCDSVKWRQQRQQLRPQSVLPHHSSSVFDTAA